MAAIEFPKQRRRWGSESTNFFGSSQSVDPGHGVPVPERVYRCEGSQYTNCGHLHVGTKIFNRCGRGGEGRGGAQGGWLACSAFLAAISLFAALFLRQLQSPRLAWHSVIPPPQIGRPKVSCNRVGVVNLFLLRVLNLYIAPIVRVCSA